MRPRGSACTRCNESRGCRLEQNTHIKTAISLDPIVDDRQTFEEHRVRYDRFSKIAIIFLENKQTLKDGRPYIRKSMYLLAVICRTIN